MNDTKTKGATPHRALQEWVVRLGFGLVFLINVMCAVQFVATPEGFMGAYELQGVPGRVALQGIGIAFLMWNVTYPPVMVSPHRFTGLAVVVVVQQLVGLVGESLLLATLPSGHDVLASSIARFIAFDGAGLVVMAASLSWLVLSRRNQRG